MNLSTKHPNPTIKIVGGLLCTNCFFEAKKIYKLITKKQYRCTNVTKTSVYYVPLVKDCNFFIGTNDEVNLVTENL